MIKNIIYVEDGSVDVDELKEMLGEETKIIVYRQGAVKPIIEQLDTPIDNTKKLVSVIRKEIAKEIISYLDTLKGCDGTPFKDYIWYKYLCKKYGVEIEE